MRDQIIDKAIYPREQLVFDFRPLLTRAFNVEVAGRLMWQLIKPHAPEVLIGPGFGAAPLLFSTAIAALAEGVELQVLMVRDKRKEHNQKKWVEGDRAAAAGKRAVLLDDFMKSGSALSLVRDALKADAVHVELVALALFFDLWEPLGSRQISTSDVPVVSLFSRHDVGLSRDCHDAAPPLMKGSAPDFVGPVPSWWRMALNSSMGYRTKCAPVIAGNAVYVADEGSVLWKHELRTGDILWSRASLETPKKGIVQRLQYFAGSILYGCYDGTLTRLDAGTGEVVWRWKIDSSIHATPCIDEPGGRIYINTEQWSGGHPGGHAQCLDFASGQVLWKHRHAWWPPGSIRYCAQSQIAVSPCNDRTLVGLNASDGKFLWSFKTHGLVRGQPAIRSVAGQARIYAATELGRLHCIDAASGALIWTQRYGPGLWHQFLTADEQCVYVLDGKWHLLAFDLASGRTRWLTRLRSPGCWRPVWCGKYLVVLSREGHLATVDATCGLKVWEGRIPGVYDQPPALLVRSMSEGGAKLAAASTSAGLLAFDIDPYYFERAIGDGRAPKEAHTQLHHESVLS